MADDDNDLTFEQALKGQIKELRKQLDEKASTISESFSNDTEPKTEMRAVEQIMAQPVASACGVLQPFGSSVSKMNQMYQ